MWKRLLLAAALAVMLILTAATPASAAIRPRIQWQQRICGIDQLWRTRDALGQHVIIRNDYWGSARVCLQTAGRYSTAWRITSAAGLRRGYIGAFPDVFYGCSYGKCSAGSALPEPLSQASDVQVTYVTEPGLPAGTVNKSLDIWVSVHPHVGGQAKGAEIMVWLDASYTPPYGRLPIVRLRGERYFVGHHRACNALGCWNYLLFRRVVPVDSVWNLSLQPFFTWAVAHGLMHQSWYLEGVEAGAEIGASSAGLTVDEFWVRG
jgi:hypothetical protein